MVLHPKLTMGPVDYFFHVLEHYILPLQNMLLQTTFQIALIL